MQLNEAWELTSKCISRLLPKQFWMACMVAGICIRYLYVPLYFQGKAVVVLLKILYVRIGICMILAGWNPGNTNCQDKCLLRVNIFMYLCNYDVALLNCFYSLKKMRVFRRWASFKYRPRLKNKNSSKMWEESENLPFSCVDIF